MIVGAVVGVFAANPSCNLEAFTSFNVDGQFLFPILFVTIACGAVSGFHSLVSSGTASKQIKSEKSMLPVSFGAMLMESMLAVIALIAVASFAQGEAAAQGLTTQPQIFAGAIANFLSALGLPHSLVFTLINLAVSAFALTSLDSVARVGRLSFQEFFLDDDVDMERMSPVLKIVTNKYFATVLTLVLAYLLTKVGYAEIWPLFGSANQLLSVLALVACAVFLKKTKRQGFMLWGPMVFMMAVTFTALAMTITKARESTGDDRTQPWKYAAAGFCSPSSDSRDSCGNTGNQKLLEKPGREEEKSHSLDTIFRKMYYLSCTQDPGPGCILSGRHLETGKCPVQIIVKRLHSPKNIGGMFDEQIFTQQFFIRDNMFHIPALIFQIFCLRMIPVVSGGDILQGGPPHGEE